MGIEIKEVNGLSLISTPQGKFKLISLLEKNNNVRNIISDMQEEDELLTTDVPILVLRGFFFLLWVT